MVVENAPRDFKVIAHIAEKELAAGDVMLLNDAIAKLGRKNVFARAVTVPELKPMRALAGVTLSFSDVRKAHVVLEELQKMQHVRDVPIVVILGNAVGAQEIRKAYPRMKIRAVIHSWSSLGIGRNPLHEAARHILVPEEGPK